MQVKHLGGADFLDPAEVSEGEIVKVTSEPVLIPAEQSTWGKERYRISVDLANGEPRRWTLNTTTSNALLDAFGEDGNLWIGKRVKIHKEHRRVGKEMKWVLFGDAYREPQQTIDADKPVDLSGENKQVMQALMKLSPEQRKSLLEAAEDVAEGEYEV